MRSKEPYRSTNAARATDETAARQLGYKSQHDLDKDRDRQSRYIDDSVRRAIIIPAQTIQFSRAAQTGTVTTAFQRAPVAGTSTSMRFPMPAAGRVIGASIWSSTAWVAGSAALQVRFSRALGAETNYLLPDVVIDGTTLDDHARTSTACWITPVKTGIRFGRGDELRLVLVLTAWSGSTDFSADLVVTYDGLSG